MSVSVSAAALAQAAALTAWPTAASLARLSRSVKLPATNPNIVIGNSRKKLTRLGHSRATAEPVGLPAARQNDCEPAGVS